MRVLLIGAGAVGQVYARHLQRGGATIGFYVRPRYAEACRAGLPLYPLNAGRPPRCLDRLGALEVYTTPEALAQTRWDQVWLCVSSTALRSGDWLDPLLAALPDTTTVVTLQPGLRDRDWLLERVPAERLVSGMIPFIAWQAPLPGEPPLDPSGIMYWIPPGAVVPMQGTPARVQPILQALKAGGMRARATPELARQLGPGSSLLNPNIAALETVGWSLAALRRPATATLASGAAREAMDISAHYSRLPRSPLRWLTRPGLLRLVVWLAPAVVPFPLETYLKVHFTKVGDQTRAQLQDWITTGQEGGLPTAHLQRLLAAMPPLA